MKQGKLRKGKVMRVKDEKLDSREKRKKKKKKRLIIKTVILVLLLVILGAALWLVYKNMNPSSENRIPEQITGKEEEPTPSAAPDEEGGRTFKQRYGRGYG